MLKHLRPILQGVKIQQCPTRAYNEKRKPKIDKKLQAAAESLAARGFLRPSKPYTPPDDVDVKLDEILTKHGLDDSSRFKSPEAKFTVLKACFDTFQHDVPNSLLHTIQSVPELKEFYYTEVNTTTPFETLKKMDLPKNMHVQADYVRFHPETDTLFNGVSAFPKSSTIVSGLTTRKKYKGHEAKRSWP